jgi:NADH:ubiquinone reductase (H+-translocating)
MQVVVVGGGFAGVKTALDLANKPGIDITLIAKGNNFEYHGALYRTATGSSPLEVAIPLREIFKRAKNVSIILDEITTLSPEKNRVHSQTGNTYSYNVLILAMGNQVNYYGIDGMESHAHTMINVPDVIALRHNIINLARGNIAYPHVVIVGAGPTGVELAGDLQNFANEVAQKYHKKEKLFRVSVIEGSDRVLPMLRPKLSQKALLRLLKLGVDVRLNTKVNTCEPGKLCLDSGEIESDLVVWTAGSRIVDFYDHNKKYFTLERGKVAVDEYLRAKGHKNIYVLGDNAATKHSGMAQTALHDAKYTARLIEKMSKGIPTIPYSTRRPIYVVPIGPRWAVLQDGDKLITGYRAWLVRRRADLWIFRNFEPYKKAIKQWRKGNKKSKY